MKAKRILSLTLSLAVASAMLGGCNEIEKKNPSPSSAVDPSADSSAVSGSSAGSSQEDASSQEPQITPDMLYELTKDTQTALPLSPGFFEWCVETTGDIHLIDTLYGAANGGNFSDDNWYALTGMSVIVTNDLYSGLAYSEENIYVLDGDGKEGISFTFGGDISLADNWHTMEYYREIGCDITKCISPFLIDKMVSADITTLNSEFCFSDRGTAMEGKAWTFRAATENVSIYHELGVDIVDLANNHVYDFGYDAFLDTLDTLKGAEIEYMGAGRNIDEASRPVYYIIEGKKIAFVAATRAEKYKLTPEATETDPGVLRCYDPTAFIEVINEAEQNADFVIANVHWGTEDSHELEDAQPETAYQYIDAGADLIIGTHAHCLQGIEYYKNVPIVYNLGNYWFSHYDIDTGLLGVTLGTDDSLDLVFYPATQRDCKTTYVGGEAEGDRILQCMRDYSFNVNIDDDGVITEKVE